MRSVLFRCLAALLTASLAFSAGCGRNQPPAGNPVGATPEAREAAAIDVVKKGPTAEKLKNGESKEVQALRSIVVVSKDENGKVTYRVRPTTPADGL